MKKFTLVFVMALMVFASGHAFAGLEWADPSLCVAGKWLVINAAQDDAIRVTVPHGVAYGDQAAGGCATVAPAPLLPMSRISVRGDDGMKVMIDGAGASPVVTVSYGTRVRTRQNDGGRMNFSFSMDNGD